MVVYNDELYHYGVLGMKWGKHKTGTNRKLSSDTKKSLAMNVTRSAIRVATPLALKKTKLGFGQQKALTILGSELGALTVGKTLKVENKKLTRDIIGHTTSASISEVSNTLLTNHSDFGYAKKLLVNTTLGVIGGRMAVDIFDELM